MPEVIRWICSCGFVTSATTEAAIRAARLDHLEWANVQAPKEQG